MSGNRTPLGTDGFWAAPRTPGPLGFNDQADPNMCTLLGNTPGVLGLLDGADPTLSLFTGNPGTATLVRLADGTALALPAGQAAATETRAPWMAIALAQAMEHKGTKEADIQKKVNYHTALGTGRASLEGTDNAWCAAFVNWCLKEAGYDVDNDGFSDRRADMGRAHGFYKVTKDKVKKGEKAAPKIRNPLFAKLDTPVYGAVAVVTKAGGHGHHAGFVASSPEAGRVVILGGNQSDSINYATYYIEATAAKTVTENGKKRTIPGQADHLMFFVPASYEAQALADTQLPTDTAKALNEAAGITAAKAGAPGSTR
jgi:uncharacterized protein (TIGR02594 family)